MQLLFLYFKKMLVLTEHTVKSYPCSFFSYKHSILILYSLVISLNYCALWCSLYRCSWGIKMLYITGWKNTRYEYGAYLFLSIHCASGPLDFNFQRHKLKIKLSRISRWYSDYNRTFELKLFCNCKLKPASTSK